MNTRTKKLIAAVFALMLLCVSFAGCGSDSSDDPVVGTWELSQVSAMGQELSAEDFLKAANYEDKGTPSVTFNGDNTVSVQYAGS